MANPSQLTPLGNGLLLWAPVHHGRWGLANCVVIASGRQAVLVDTPYTAELARSLQEALRRLAPAASIGTVINTHANGDHCYTNGLHPGAEIISTRAGLEHACLEPTPAQMQKLVHHSDRSTPLGWYLHEHFGQFDWSGLERTPPTRTFDGRLSLRVGEIPVELIEVGPAHTAGDLIVHLPQQRTVCAGDVVFIGDHPVHWAGPLIQIIDACQTIRNLAPETIIPGHGPVIGLDELDDYIAYLEYLREQIHTLHAAGMSADAAAAELLRANRYPHLGLPERLVVVTAVEYRHLTGDTNPPNLPALVAGAARHAYSMRADNS
ncbi:MAG TPA: MBL fold metallo-hydrolase [Streptomyces sp.]|nr:MBL fold metallo-hydrolase [Streptomyces sp.]